MSWTAGRTPDRYVSGFGGAQHAIYSPVGTPKPREECTPFTFELYAGAVKAPMNPYRTIEPNIKGQEKFIKGLATLTKKQDAARKRREKLVAKAA